MKHSRAKTRLLLELLTTPAIKCGINFLGIETVERM
jgi:arginyl-tRNA synthetase